MNKNNELNQVSKRQLSKKPYLLHLKQIASNPVAIGSFFAALATSLIIHAVQISDFQGRIELNLGLDGVQLVVDNGPPATEVEPPPSLESP